MITHWAIADLHLSHKNIIKYCGRTLYMNDIEKELYKNFSQADGKNTNDFDISDETCALMNHDIIGNINDRAKKDDVIWCLGDVGFGNNFKKDMKHFTDQIICKQIMFIKGNHDHGEICQTLPDMIEVCIFQDGKFCTGNDVRWHHNKYGNTTITLCHYALCTWNRSHSKSGGSWHLYGHSHCQIEDIMDKTWPDRKSLDVGVDNVYKLFGYYGPINLEQIAQVFADKKKKYELQL